MKKYLIILLWMVNNNMSDYYDKKYTKVEFIQKSGLRVVETLKIYTY